MGPSDQNSMDVDYLVMFPCLECTNNVLVGRLFSRWA